jgi:hypothetical protein
LFAYTHGSISAFYHIYSFLCGYLKRPTFIHTQGVTEEFGDTFRKCERKSGFKFDRMHFGGLLSHIYENPVEREVDLTARIISVFANIKRETRQVQC